MTSEERDALIESARKTPWLDAMKRRETEALLAALDEARAQLAAMRDAALRLVAVQGRDEARIVRAMGDVNDAAADTATAAAEHERRVRADERARALREAAGRLRLTPGIRSGVDAEAQLRAMADDAAKATGSL